MIQKDHAYVSRANRAAACGRMAAFVDPRAAQRERWKQKSTQARRANRG